MNNPIIVALDLPSPQKALKLAEELAHRVCGTNASIAGCRICPTECTEGEGLLGSKEVTL